MLVQQKICDPPTPLMLFLDKFYVNLENSRFNWVFLNVGPPYLNWRKNNGTRRRYSQLCRHFKIYNTIKENTWITLLQLIWSLLNVYPFIKFSYFLLLLIYNIENGAASATAAAPAGLVDVEADVVFSLKILVFHLFSKIFFRFFSKVFSQIFERFCWEIWV